MATKEILTTFEAARLCSVSYNTIKNWIKRGLLDAYRTAGGHLRIKSSDVEIFCRKQNIPIGVLKDGANRKVLIVNGEEEIHTVLTDSLNQCYERLEIFAAGNCFEAGAMVGIHKPDLVIIDMMAPGVNPKHLSQMVRKTPAIKHAKILALVGAGPENGQDCATKLGADICIPRPVDQTQLCRTIKILLKPAAGVRVPKRYKTKDKK